jgi:hypothetical protein
MEALMISPRQQKFRADFRASVPEDYDGISHGVWALSIGVLALAGLWFVLDGPLSWLELAVLPAVAIGWNVMEWIVHTQVLHRPRKNRIARALYVRHTLTHHQFFTAEAAELEGTRDLSIVFFPLFALPATLVLSLPFAALAWLVISLNAGVLLLMGVTFMYVLFEIMHLGAHLPENRWVRGIPLLNTMRRHHIAHHDQRLMMEKNMNFTFPFMDWLMGTSDVRRGFWGTMFNGYESRFVEKPKTRRSEAESAAPAARTTR